MGPMKMLFSNPGFSVGVAAILVVIMMVFMFLRRGMMRGGGMRGPGPMGKMGRWDDYPPESPPTRNEQSRSCPGCGSRIELGWKVCPQCGHALV